MSGHPIDTRATRGLRAVRSSSAGVAVDPPAGLPPVIDLMDAAGLLGLGRTTAYKLVRTGQWPTPVIRIGRLIRVPIAPLRDLLIGSPSTSAPLTTTHGE